MLVSLALESRIYKTKNDESFIMPTIAKVIRKPHINTRKTVVFLVVL